MNDLTCPKCGYELFKVNGEMFTAKGEKNIIALSV